MAREDWDGDDRHRPLTARGERQAVALPGLISRRRCETIISSPTVRCRATVQPLAARRGLPVKTTKRLAEGEGEDALDLVLDAVVDLVLCTHGDVVDVVLDGLRRLGWAVPPRHRKPKGGVWALSRDRCEFLPPAT